MVSVVASWYCTYWLTITYKVKCIKFLITLYKLINIFIFIQRKFTPSNSLSILFGLILPGTIYYNLIVMEMVSWISQTLIAVHCIMQWWQYCIYNLQFHCIMQWWQYCIYNLQFHCSCFFQLWSNNIYSDAFDGMT